MSRRTPGELDGDAIMAACASKGTTLAQIALEADLSATTLYNWVRHINRPNVDNLRRVAHALGAQAKDFILIDQDTATLADLRGLAGKSPNELAAALGISAGALDHLERGRTKLSDARALALAAALGYPKDQIVAAYERVRPPRRK